MGYRPTEEYVKENYGEGWQRDDRMLGNAQQPGTGTAPPSNFAEPVPRDAIDDLVAQELQQWQPIMAPMVDVVQAFLDDAARRGLTAEQVLAELPGLLDQMDDGNLSRSLTETAFAARLAAEAGLPPE